MNQCCNVFNWIHQSNFPWNFNRNTYIHENSFENVVSKIATILPWPQWIKSIGSVAFCNTIVPTYPWHSCYTIKRRRINSNTPGRSAEIRLGSPLETPDTMQLSHIELSRKKTEHCLNLHGSVHIRVENENMHLCSNSSWTAVAIKTLLYYIPTKVIGRNYLSNLNLTWSI